MGWATLNTGSWFTEHNIHRYLNEFWVNFPYFSVSGSHVNNQWSRPLTKVLAATREWSCELLTVCSLCCSMRICRDLECWHIPIDSRKVFFANFCLYFTCKLDQRTEEINESLFFLRYSLKREKEEIKTEPLLHFRILEATSITSKMILDILQRLLSHGVSQRRCDKLCIVWHRMRLR